MSLRSLLVAKKDGKNEVFDLGKISDSILKAGKDTGEYGKTEALKIVAAVKRQLKPMMKHATIDVEEIRNVVEPSIANAGYFRTAKYYILFGSKTKQARKKV